MSKEKLQEILVESFINNKIDEAKLIKLSKRVEQISEARAEEILNEIDWKKVALIGGVSLTGLLYIWATTLDNIKRMDEQWKKCRDKCISIYAPKIKKAKQVGETSDIEDMRDDYTDCKIKCDNLYEKKVRELKKKKKEVKEKIKKAKEEIKRKKALAKKKG